MTERNTSGIFSKSYKTFKSILSWLDETLKEAAFLLVLILPICFYVCVCKEIESYIAHEAYGLTNGNSLKYEICIVIIFFLYIRLVLHSNPVSFKMTIVLLMMMHMTYHSYFCVDIKEMYKNLAISANEIKTYALITEITTRSNGAVYYYTTRNNNRYRDIASIKGVSKEIEIGDTIIIGYSAKYELWSRPIELFPTKEQIEEMKKQNDPYMKDLSWLEEELPLDIRQEIPMKEEKGETVQVMDKSKEDTQKEDELYDYEEIMILEVKESCQLLDKKKKSTDIYIDKGSQVSTKSLDRIYIEVECRDRYGKTHTGFIKRDLLQYIKTVKIKK